MITDEHLLSQRMNLDPDFFNLAQSFRAYLTKGVFSVTDIEEATHMANIIHCHDNMTDCRLTGIWPKKDKGAS